MGATYISSDFHLGHKNIAKYRSYISSTEENTRLIVDEWKSRIHKRDVVYLLGDIAFDKDHLFMMRGLPGRKILVRGNHDNYVSSEDLLQVFDKIEGLMSKWRFWLSHAPIHPQELRGKCNIHGHVHNATVPDKRYFNACCDNLYTTYGSNFIKLEQVREILT